VRNALASFQNCNGQQQNDEVETCEDVCCDFLTNLLFSLAILFNLDDDIMAKIENPSAIESARKSCEYLLGSYLKTLYGSTVANEKLLALGKFKDLAKQFLAIRNQRIYGTFDNCL